jgi:hypothetical protein
MFQTGFGGLENNYENSITAMTTICLLNRHKKLKGEQNAPLFSVSRYLWKVSEWQSASACSIRISGW